MLIVTHPRSGSNEICRIIEKCLTPSKSARNLSEFFNIGDRTAFGNLLDAVRFLDSKNSPITVSVLKIDTTITPDVPANYNCFVPDEVTFNSKEELDKWYTDEIEKRLAVLSLFNSAESFCLVKHFISEPYPDNQFTAKLIKAHAEKDKLVVNYRRNILESVLSALIKMYYIDQAREGNNLKGDGFLNEIRGDGHNLYNMPPIEPAPIEIDIKKAKERAIPPVLLLFKIYHQLLKDSPDCKNILVYEDVMESRELTLTYQGQTKLYNLDSLSPRIIEIFDENGERKLVTEERMNYGERSKANYFVNSHILVDLIKEAVDNMENELPGFKQTLEKLGVIY